ncbi:hypothetical protein CFV95_018895 [Leptospira interrogans]|uniref:Uncharacterized protein n=1 Tax=Leptospira interrogans TaxID=173 RepID=A0AAV9G3B3_LEPIR|nr:hypothetical protein [Leptospira interrogans]KAK2618639.1 hypothetical protein CFV95_006220 [Leptospira interrogans]KAK2618939.1 hypothetical protein CFV95_007975 [Leptospira interrogans]KAK2620496.1 hypothetical protein CFV95_016540 [Leptospira interrogans]KAK2620925.1 hypothetical protein CFV95_018895 [Leptospira interrogans]UML85865.1 hypothetical protein FH587_10545 [Leptospira interrogans]
MSDINLTKKSWEEFQSTGLLLFVNNFLHIFGWALVFECDGEKVISVYPARIKYRGFSEIATEEAFKKVTKYLSSSIKELKKEVMTKKKFDEDFIFPVNFGRKINNE